MKEENEEESNSKLMGKLLMALAMVAAGCYLIFK